MEFRKLASPSVLVWSMFFCGDFAYLYLRDLSCAIFLY
ncbi:prolipodiacylglyceryl transferase domain protein [Chlamydia psittaci C19/98]|nr:prolipodiacylglyceryl transferase domain protein [Chlamydia psittaci C19/98]